MGFRIFAMLESVKPIVDVMVETLPMLRGFVSDQVPSRSWLDLPETVAGPSPDDRSAVVGFRLPTDDIRKAVTARRRQPVMELWSVVIGEPPPVPHVWTWQGNVPADIGLTRLALAHACFQGIKRPLAEDDFGDDVFVFVLKPEFFYVYEPHMVCQAHKRPAPADKVFAVYARIDRQSGNGAAEIKGAITHWHFVEADPGDPKLPKDHLARYRKRRW